MIVDSSAIIAILFEEPDAARLSEAISSAPCSISVAGVLECSMVIIGRKGEGAQQSLVSLLERLRIRTIEISLEQGQLAIDAFRRYGRGRHPARLNMGDCFAYALARSRNEALLFKGDDFSRTDVKVAV